MSLLRMSTPFIREARRAPAAVTCRHPSARQGFLGTWSVGGQAASPVSHCGSDRDLPCNASRPEPRLGLRQLFLAALPVQLRTETPPRAAITIDGERFFEKAFSSGKAVAACFAFAMLTGWRDA